MGGGEKTNIHIREHEVKEFRVILKKKIEELIELKGGKYIDDKSKKNTENRKIEKELLAKDKDP